MAPRVSSIKTRIKTPQSQIYYFQNSAPRVSSIKTRIKTNLFILFLTIHPFLREYLPLKQGLRLKLSVLNSKLKVLREYLPLKQGLRQSYGCFSLFLFHFLREYLPLKQGLRPYGRRVPEHYFLPPRVSSIKTRIKTSLT